MLFLKKLANSLSLRYRYFLKPKAKTNPVFVVGTARSGTSLLLSYLRSIPVVKAPGEVLNPWLPVGPPRWTPIKTACIRHMRYSLNTPNAQICVLKLLEDHLKFYDVNIESVARAFPDARFIIVYRKQVGRQFVSMERSKKKGIWNSNTKHEFPKISVNETEFRKYCDENQRFYDLILSSELLKNRHVVIDYETLVADAQGLFDSTLFDFLKLPKSSVSTELKKQGESNLRDMVENFTEVRTMIEEQFTIGGTIV